ncbi:Ribosomal RNA processing protein 1 homolog [Strongyloides ratti]|uniref:Ribosomal RNA processing protein 1 homolog n=1 Tax=Strongyloides ratti TaxID=34506 RepID=A0A090MW81_STRRB|nr:Ribosomal RNA processing protein 1 homolog [Strongyloides ratti]CEF63518.1 Ribosomal RNA processing protein 1 homolog [Strongyloides ratti]
MQDKALLHEDLCDRIVAVHDIFKRANERISFYYCLLSFIDKNILSIDKWRINKFLMLVRRIFRHIFSYTSKNSWNESICQKYIEMIDKNIFNNEERQFSNVMISHIVSVFMDEFDKALNNVPCEPEQQFIWYAPFLKALEKRATSDYVFERITKEIFEGILIIIEMENNDDTAIDKSNYRFPLSHISNSIFNIAKSDSTKSKRRKVLYNIVEKFKLAEKKYN